jgi:hypothetical protein
MKISTLTENPTVASAPTNSSQAPEFGRSDKFLEEKEEQIDETTSGSVATVATPVGGTQRRAKGSMFAGIKTSKKFANSTGVNEAYGRYGRRDAYQRDYDSSVSGMGKHDSLAYKLDGGANDEGWDEPQRSYQARPAYQPRPRPTAGSNGMYFYNVPAGREQSALAHGLKQTRTGKWFSKQQNKVADSVFGPGRYWEPKNESISEAESTTDNLRSWQVVIMNNYYRGKYSDYSGRYYYVLASSPQEAKQVVLDNADGILQDLLSMKSQNGRKILPRSSAVRITADRIGKIEDGTVSGRMSTTRYRPMFSPQGVMMVKLTNGAIEDVQEQDVAEAYQFKGPFPFDVDHMHGGRGINLPSAPTKKFFTDKKQWERAVDDINSSKYDDNSDYIGVTGRSTVEIDGREWARWSDAQQKGYIELSSMSEQGVAEGVAETLPMDDAVKVLRQYGADNFKTTSNELYFYKNGRPLSVDLIWGNEGERSVNLSQLNSATRQLKGQGVAEGSSTNAEVTKRAKAAAQKAGKTFNTDVEYRLWYAITTQANAATRKADKKQGVAEDKGMSQYNAFKREWRAKHGSDAKVPGYDSKEYTSYCYRQNDKKQGVVEGSTTTWEVCFDYGPHQSETVKIQARSAQEAVDKVETAAEKKGRSIMVNWARPAEQGVSEEQVNEKSQSQAQFRTMAAVAHNPKFAKKVGISQKVGKEFHSADRKQDYKDLPKQVDEAELNEEDMLAQSLYKALDLFKKAKDRELGAKPKDKGVQKKVDEVSSELLGRYKKGASAQSSQLDKEAFAGAPDAKQKIEKSNKRYSGIIKATKKQFDNDAKGVAEDSDPCWDNYKQIGMKNKNGKKVPNCVPKE